MPKMNRKPTTESPTAPRAKKLKMTQEGVAKKRHEKDTEAQIDSDSTAVTVVQFYSKSKDIRDLGRLGSGAPDPSLNGIPNWRKVLSNFHEAPIEVQGKRYPSVEHNFHAMKALCSNRPQYAQAFEEGGSIGLKSPLEAKRAGGKAGFAKVGATLNVPQWIATRDKAVARALKARTKSDPLFVKILLATRQRKLYLLHLERGGANNYWGGSIQKATRKRVGRNRLGELLMMLREQQCEGEGNSGAGGSSENGATSKAACCKKAR